MMMCQKMRKHLALVPLGTKQRKFLVLSVVLKKENGAMLKSLWMLFSRNSKKIVKMTFQGKSKKNGRQPKFQCIPKDFVDIF